MLSLVACSSGEVGTVVGTTATPEITPTATIEPVNVFVHYEYVEAPDEWLEGLPAGELVQATYYDSLESDGVWEGSLRRINHPDVMLFSFVPERSQDLGGCEIHLSFFSCLELPESSLTIKMGLEYCDMLSGLEGALVCRANDLSMTIRKNEISFSVDDNFSTFYREGVKQVIDYVGGGELPGVLEPNRTYTVIIKQHRTLGDPIP